LPAFIASVCLSVCVCAVHVQNARILSALAVDLKQTGRHDGVQEKRILKALCTYYTTVRTRVTGYRKAHSDAWAKKGELQRFTQRREKVTRSSKQRQL